MIVFLFYLRLNLDIPKLISPKLVYRYRKSPVSAPAILNQLANQFELKFNRQAFMHMIRTLVNKNDFSNQIRRLSVSKNDLFTGLMRYYVPTESL